MGCTRMYVIRIHVACFKCGCHHAKHPLFFAVAVERRMGLYVMSRLEALDLR